MYTLRFRAYASPDVLRELKSQLRLLCEAYNTLRYADIAFHERDGKWLNRTELRQLALDLRRQDREYKRVFSQVFQNVADRYCEARDRLLQGLARFPRERKPERYRSLVYPQKGWKILSTRPARSGRKSWIYLSLSGLGVFKVLAHRPLPDRVTRVAVKVTPTRSSCPFWWRETFTFKPKRQARSLHSTLASPTSWSRQTVITWITPAFWRGSYPGTGHSPGFSPERGRAQAGRRPGSV
ncbi:hypothetical protein L3N51_02327 [Metallosphaera sp. J1]|nr:hypothetical protein [Metallosphaera javensis (ex Hofmann et al. 2022)]BCS93197.1 MAG: putative transposase or IS (ACLAME 318) [Metallosphaera javensis (ex Sakai et al. 2022)]